ncbi:PQQ-binding-like beta-propeller repeat protein, partial [Bacteroidota bacterium]
KARWNVDLVKKFNGVLGDFGYSESPVVDDKKVYYFIGGKAHNIIALDKQNGDLIWSSPALQDYVSYGTPILLDQPERKFLVGTSRNYIHVLNRMDGTLLSSYQLEEIKEGYEHCNSVIYRDGYIYYVQCQENSQGGVKLKLSPDGVSLDEVWRNRKVINVFEGFVLIGNCLYTTLENKKLVCVDTNTGKISGSVRAVFGNIVYADNKLFIYGHNGIVQLFSLANGNPELKSEMRITHGSGQHFSYPVIANGVMYIRRGDALMAYRVK